MDISLSRVVTCFCEMVILVSVKISIFLPTNCGGDTAGEFMF